MLTLLEKTDLKFLTLTTSIGASRLTIQVVCFTSRQSNTIQVVCFTLKLNNTIKPYPVLIRIGLFYYHNHSTFYHHNFSTLYYHYLTITMKAVLHECNFSRLISSSRD